MSTGIHETVKTICPMCGVGCGVEVRVRDGAILGVGGDPDHPVNRGRLCTKGTMLHRMVQTRDRLRHPLLRTDRSAPFKQVTMDEAIGWAADRLGAIRRNHGPDAVAFYVSGQLTTEDYYVANKLVKGFLGTNNIDTNSRLCMASTVMGYKLALGSDAPPGCYEDMEKADVVLILGSNMAECHPVLFRRLEEAKRSRPEVFIALFDPRRTPTASLADMHLRVRPGTDAILLQAMLHLIFEEGLANKAFIDKHTEGVEEVRRAAGSFPPEHAASICGVPLEDLREVTRRFAQAQGAVSLWAMGLNQATDGVARNVALINLHLATGQIGRAGAGPFSLTGQANAMGGREVGGLSTQLAAHRDLSNPAHRAEVASFWGVPEIRPEPGLQAVALSGALEAGRVKALWIACTNPLVTLPDTGAVERALRRAELVVVQDLYHPTDTTRHADLVLPAAGWAEKDGTMTNSERGLAHCGKALDPPGEAEPDWRIFARLAHALGHGSSFAWESAEEVFAEHVALTRGTDIDITGLDYARLAGGPVQWPLRNGNGETRRFSDLRFARPNGRALFVVPASVAGADPEPPDETYPLRLLTGRVRDQWHTRTKTGRVVELDRHSPAPTVTVAPDDAAPRGIKDGDLVEVRSRRGVLTLPAHLTDAVPAGSVFVPFHWGALESPHARANDLTLGAVDPVSGQPALKSATVELTRRTLRAPGKTVVLGNGEEAAALSRALRRLDGSARIETFGGDVLRVDAEARRITLSTGEEVSYERLVISPRSLVRGVAGAGAPSGRILCLAPDADMSHHLAGLAPGSSVAVVGEGASAFRATLAAAAAGLKPFWIVRERRPLASVLDEIAWSLIEPELGALGVRVVPRAAIQELIEGDGSGNENVTLVLERGATQEVARVFYLLGTEPDLELARRAGVAVNRGIVVDQRLSATRAGISAIGPGMELEGWMQGPEEEDPSIIDAQAEVLARCLCGDPGAKYHPPAIRGSVRLGDLESVWLGEPAARDERDETIRYLDRRRRVYRKAVIHDGRLRGVLLVGDVRGERGLRRAIEDGTDVEPFRRQMLAPQEDLFPDVRGGHVVCACLLVTEDAIRSAACAGAKRVEDVSRATGLGSTCGNCLPEARQIISSFQ